MTSLIEQAAQRLEQLRQAGVVLPGDEQAQTAPDNAMPPVPAPVAVQPAAAAPVAAAPVAAPAVGLSIQDDGHHPSSKRVELDVVALAAQGFLMPHTPRSQTGDQYRVIKRPLIKNAMGKGAATINHANLLMVTSALAGEGKSFTSINLALSIAAELDNTVMLVDADVARPSVLRMLGLPQGPGLLDVLEERVEMSEVLLRTNVEKLTILPSGTPHPRATELLASDAMRQLLDNMAKRYPRPHHHLRLPAAAAHDGVPCAGLAHGSDHHRRARRENRSERGAAGPGRHRDLPGQDDAAQPGQPQCGGRLRLWVRLRVWLRLRIRLWQQ